MLNPLSTIVTGDVAYNGPTSSWPRTALISAAEYCREQDYIDETFGSSRRAHGRIEGMQFDLGIDQLGYIHKNIYYGHLTISNSLVS